MLLIDDQCVCVCVCVCVCMCVCVRLCSRPLMFLPCTWPSRLSCRCTPLDVPQVGPPPLLSSSSSSSSSLLLLLLFSPPPPPPPLLSSLPPPSQFLCVVHSAPLATARCLRVAHTVRGTARSTPASARRSSGEMSPQGARETRARTHFRTVGSRARTHTHALLSLPAAVFMHCC